MSLSLVKRGISRVRSKGLGNTVNLVLDQVPLLPKRSLRAWYRFDPWHIVPYSRRPYAQAIVAHLNRRQKRDRVLEIGCGLGDMLRRLQFKEKIGFDQEQAVLDGAAFIAKFQNANRGKIQFKQFEFTTAELSGKFDVIILCNWIHNIEPSFLKSKFADLYQNHLLDGGEIIFDAVKDPAYLYNHTSADLTGGLQTQLKALGEFARGREIFSAKKVGAV